MTQPPGDEDLFAGALAMPAAERSGYIARACADDSAALGRLTALLDSFADAVNFVAERCVEQIGAYRLLRELGEGGCGIAYLAEQLAPVKRHVALKIIKPGMDTKSVVARFEAERQLLALMDHPNVAKVFDAGSTPAGRPYFVMELVRGIRVTEYCEQLHLSIAERLQLFVQVCQAIQHAHHKGVMHRDIKPSNVLVTMHDGLPVVKVIDFGIAKATQGPMSEQTLHTAVDQFIGTPAYVSPEQTDHSQRNVDTRSDIYSLGVLLYELVTGHTPLDTHKLLQSSAEEMRRLVREEEPLTPSARLKSLARSAKDVQGDLDWIVMRCLEKEPVRRYQTVNDLLLDIQRHLHHQPILARPPSIVYTLRKLARRNRAMFAAAVAAAVLVVAFAISTSIQIQRVAAARDRAEQESSRAEKVAGFMLDTLSKTEPFGYAETGQPETAKELLDRAGRWVRQDLNQDPEVRAQLLESIGRAYRRRLEFGTSVGFLQEALTLRRKLSGAGDDAATVQVMIGLARSLIEVDALEDSSRLLEEGAAALHRLGQEHSFLYADLRSMQGSVQMNRGRPDEAMKHFEAALALTRDLLGPRHSEVADVLRKQSGAFTWQDELQKAEDAAREAVAINRATLPELHPDRAQALSQLGEVLRLRHKLREAKLVTEEALRGYRRMYGESNRQVAGNLDTLAKIAREQRQPAAAEALARQALEMNLRTHGPHLLTGYYRTSLALVQIDRHEYAEAEVQLRGALAAFADMPLQSEPYVASAEYLFGEVMLATNRPEEAEALFQTAMNRSNRAGDPKWRVARAASGLGAALYAQGRTDDAERYLMDSYRILAGDPNADEGARVAARERIVRFYSARAPHDSVQIVTGTARAQTISAANRTDRL
ncbi:MAG TPA: serine/threonine-protein kinase [Steroidobacteraceae bacterium]|jgi:eukaryotic-like serine/threonine-protein kinase|nr:serine/threonine-protein kinase [Steroidobacteraceae bacterium]